MTIDQTNAFFTQNTQYLHMYRKVRCILFNEKSLKKLYLPIKNYYETDKIYIDGEKVGYYFVMKG